MPTPDTPPAAPPDGDAHAPPDGFSTLFEFLPIGAYRCTPDGVLLRANPALLRLLDHADEAALRDAPAPRYLDPDRRAEFMARLLGDGQVQGMVSEIRHPRTGERRWISENAHAVRDAQGRLLFLEGTVEDVSDRVRDAQALREITEQMPGMFYRLRFHADGRRQFTFVSEGLRGLLGLAPAELLADSSALDARWHPEDREHIRQASAQAVQRAEPLTLEHRVRLDSGEVKWVHVSATPVRGEQQTLEYVGVVVDITARREAEAQLRANEARWKLALESTGDGVWDWNLRDGTELLSPQILAMYGFAPGELGDQARGLDERTHPDDLARMQQDRQAHFEGRSPTYVNEHRIRCANGEWKWVLSRGLVIERDAQGAPLRMIGTHTDITPRKQAEALRRERDRAEAADRAKTQLLSRVSHELRTPLNAVLGFAQLLDRVGSLGPREREWVGHVLNSGRHLLGLVDDVLDLSSAQSGQLALSTVALPLDPLLDEAWTMVAAALPQAIEGLKLRRDRSAGPPLQVRADARRLRQVACNLLSNAVKYNRAGGELRVRSWAEDDEVLFSVRDGGQGLSPAQLARLFSPFERLGAQHTAVEGSGLGLALSRQLVEAMGGSIAVRSEPGVGTELTVRLPAAGPV